MIHTSESQQLSSVLLRRLHEFASIGSTPEGGGVTRLGYSDVEKTAIDRFITLAEMEAMEVRRDAAGNVIARRRALNNDLSAVACGSHLDTVYDGGNFDGVLGSLAALDIIRRLNEQEIVTERPIEIIVFACEESSRFGISTIGSKAMAGLIDVASIADVTDAEGTTFAQALQSQGLSIDAFASAVRLGSDLHAFLELHIEQGPMLETTKTQIGLVTGIAAPVRLKLTVTGVAAHTGTTVMSMRHDAMLAGAEITLAVEKLVEAEQAAQSVGTVGVFNVYPNAANTIPGEVQMIAEFRSVDEASKARLLRHLEQEIQEIETRRGVNITSRKLSDEEPVLLADEVRGAARAVCEDLGYSYLEMVSGAGHDTMNIAHICPTGLVFIPSVDGISHNPKEYSKDDDVLSGSEVLYQTVVRLAGGRKA